MLVIIQRRITGSVPWITQTTGCSYMYGSRPTKLTSVYWRRSWLCEGEAVRNNDWQQKFSPYRMAFNLETTNGWIHKFKYMYCRISVFENIYNYHYIVCENPIESGFFIFSGFCSRERAKIKFNENVLPVGYMCRMILIGYKYNIVKHLIEIMTNWKTFALHSFYLNKVMETTCLVGVGRLTGASARPSHFLLQSLARV